MSVGAARLGSSLLSGVIFGFGLILSGMADPAKVLNFLDLSGTWDPSLAFVMGAAVTVTAAGYRVVFMAPAPIFDAAFHVSTAKTIDRALLAGAAVFGLGWGLAGFCPGPALTSLALVADGTFVFVLAMVIGMWAARFTPKI